MRNGIANYKKIFILNEILFHAYIENNIKNVIILP